MLWAHYLLKWSNLKRCSSSQCLPRVRDSKAFTNRKWRPTVAVNETHTLHGIPWNTTYYSTINVCQGHGSKVLLGGCNKLIRSARAANSFSANRFPYVLWESQAVFITVLTIARHFLLSKVKWIHFTPWHPVLLSRVSMLSSHLCLDFAGILSPWGFANRTFMHFVLCTLI